MFPPTDNPAKRLLDLLNDARARKNMPVQKLWAEVFDIPEMDAPSCYRVLGYLNDLVDSVETRIRQLPDLNHELYLRDLPTIRQVICPPTIAQHWHELKRPLDQGGLTGLEFCANELSKGHGEDPVPQEELDAIKKEFADLFADVGAADLNPDLKLILFDLLTTAVLAIDHYKISGNDGLKKAVAYTLGVLTLHKKEFLASKNEKLVKKAFAAIKHLCTAVTVAYRVHQLTGWSMPDILQLPEFK